MDYEQMEYELWNLNTNDFSLSNLHKWDSKDSYDGYSTHYRIYGITPDNKYLYYTNNFISSHISLFEMQLNSGEVSQIQIDTTDGDYALSPNGEFFAYEKNKTVWISDVEGSNKNAIPRIDSLQFIGSPTWYLGNDRIIVSAFGPYSEQGLWLVNLVDSSHSKISDQSSVYYDISTDGSKLVIEDTEPLESPLIRYKSVNSDDLTTLHEGTSPKFVDLDNAVLYEILDGLYISDLSGETNKIFNKTGGGDKSRNRQVAVSPNHQLIGYSDREGLHIYDSVTDELVYTLVNTEFNPSDSENWSSIDVSISELTFSENNELIYFVVERRFFSDGC